MNAKDYALSMYRVAALKVRGQENTPECIKLVKAQKEYEERNAFTANHVLNSFVRPRKPS